MRHILINHTLVFKSYTTFVSSGPQIRGKIDKNTGLSYSTADSSYLQINGFVMRVAPKSLKLQRQPSVM